MTSAREEALRVEIVETARRMNALGLNRGVSGNVSARIEGGFLVTPSGVPYERMMPGGIVAMDADGGHDEGLKPSSEWRFHRDIMDARPDANAILHAHSHFATVLSCLERGIPAVHYMVAAAGGADIRCAPYATFGTQALSDHALRALEGRKACLLANHGMIVLGHDLEDALALAVEVEHLASLFWHASLLGAPAILSDEEMARVIARFAGYGRSRG